MYEACTMQDGRYIYAFLAKSFNLKECTGQWWHHFVCQSVSLVSIFEEKYNLLKQSLIFSWYSPFKKVLVYVPTVQKSVFKSAGISTKGAAFNLT